jgi:hypothetical protein
MLNLLRQCFIVVSIMDDLNLLKIILIRKIQKEVIQLFFLYLIN